MQQIQGLKSPNLLVLVSLCQIKKKNKENITAKKVAALCICISK